MFLTPAHASVNIQISKEIKSAAVLKVTSFTFAQVPETCPLLYKITLLLLLLSVYSKYLKLCCLPFVIVRTSVRSMASLLKVHDPIFLMYGEPKHSILLCSSLQNETLPSQKESLGHESPWSIMRETGSISCEWAVWWVNSSWVVWSCREVVSSMCNLGPQLIRGWSCSVWE